VYEPFGIINLEAMACERPVVASAVGGIPEVVVPEKTGLLVPPADPRALADALNRVQRDPALGRAMGLASRRRVEEQFSLTSIAARTQQMYQELLHEKGRCLQHRRLDRLLRLVARSAAEETGCRPGGIERAARRHGSDRAGRPDRPRA
jgi:hypothetical protein